MEEIAFDESVFVLDCIWELFVLVASGARGKRPDIQLALATAMVSSFSLIFLLPSADIQPLFRAFQNEVSNQSRLYLPFMC